MDDMIIDRLSEDMLPAFREFCRLHWGEEHPLVHNRQMFDFYFREGSLINFVAAYEKESKEIHSVCGFIKTGKGENPDLFISYILTKKGGRLNLGFKLLEKICEITGCRTIACNNIRKKTAGLYEFFGYTVADMNHWVRPNRKISGYSLCEIDPEREYRLPPDIYWQEIGEQQLCRLDFERYRENRPFKDIEYIKKRYLSYPWHGYRLFEAEKDDDFAVAVVREFSHGGKMAARICDFLGYRPMLRFAGCLADRLMEQTAAEFVDLYESGADSSLLLDSGFLTVGEKDTVPLYLSPPLLKNIDITVFYSSPENYLMMRADGDQDRPNLGNS